MLTNSANRIHWKLKNTYSVNANGAQSMFVLTILEINETRKKFSQ